MSAPTILISLADIDGCLCSFRFLPYECQPSARAAKIAGSKAPLLPFILEGQPMTSMGGYPKSLTWQPKNTDAGTSLTAASPAITDAKRSLRFLSSLVGSLL